MHWVKRLIINDYVYIDRAVPKSTAKLLFFSLNSKYFSVFKSHKG